MIWDVAVIKCTQTKETWRMTCKENEWIGSFGNCSEPGKANFIPNLQDFSNTLI